MEDTAGGDEVLIEMVVLVGVVMMEMLRMEMLRMEMLMIVAVGVVDGDHKDSGVCLAGVAMQTGVGD